MAAMALVLAGCANAPEAKGAPAVALTGAFTQGGLVLGRTEPGSRVEFEGRPVHVSPDGLFLIGFGREAPPEALLRVTTPDGRVEQRRITVAARTYEIQRIDGLPEKMVSPDKALLARIAAEAAAVAHARAHDTEASWFAQGFVWPATGPISGVYGSQRILNGKPRQPHYGVDIAAPAGTPVGAPGEGIVVLAEPDLYLSGGTIIIDHGQGLSSTLMHLASVEVRVGDHVMPGERIGTVGATGRATGPHLDWRINLFDTRIDPQLVIGPMPDAPDRE
jgi:murein DD-endopeptidase MepM/ murein hydrolase activator NlpD